MQAGLEEVGEILGHHGPREREQVLDRKVHLQYVCSLISCDCTRPPRSLTPKMSVNIETSKLSVTELW